MRTEMQIVLEESPRHGYAGGFIMMEKFA